MQRVLYRGLLCTFMTNVVRRDLIIADPLFQGTACQRAAWPEHKAFCTKVQTSPSPRTKFLVRRANAVFAYASRHRPLLFSIAYHELKIRYDKENAERKFLWVGFKPRDYEETKWDVVRVEVRLVETLEGEVRDEIQSGRRLRLQDPVLNVFAIMLYDVECMVSKCLFGSVLDDDPERGLRIF